MEPTKEQEDVGSRGRREEARSQVSIFFNTGGGGEVNDEVVEEVQVVEERNGRSWGWTKK